MRVPAPRVALVALIVALLAGGLAAVVIRAGEGGSKVASRGTPTTSPSPTATFAPVTSTTAAPAPATTQPVPSALAATFALDGADKQEQGSAYSGLLEGDAKTLEALWAGKFLSAGERQRAASEANSSGSASAILSAPRFLLDQLYFPYTDGKDFVVSRYRSGGWAAVDAAYGRPPDSTQVVIHPDLYNAGKTWSTPGFPDLAAATGCTPVRAN